MVPNYRQRVPTRVDIARRGNRKAPTPDPVGLSDHTIQPPTLSTSVLRLTSRSQFSTLLTPSDWRQKRLDLSRGRMQPSRGRKRPSHLHRSSHSAQRRPTHSTANGTTAVSANRTPSAQSTVMGSMCRGLSCLGWGAFSSGKEEEATGMATVSAGDGTGEGREQGD